MAHLLCFNLNPDGGPLSKLFLLILLNTSVKKIVLSTHLLSIILLNISEVLRYPFLQPRANTKDLRRPANKWIDCKNYTERTNPINYKVFKGIFKGSPRTNQKVKYNRNVGQQRRFNTPKIRGGSCMERCVEFGLKPKICSRRCRCMSRCTFRGNPILLCKRRCQARKSKR